MPPKPPRQTPRRHSKPLVAGGTLLILLAIGLARLLGFGPSSNTGAQTPTTTTRATQPSASTEARDARFADEAGILEAIRDKRSGVLVDVGVRVKRLLPDDADGSKHQRFIVELSGGRTLLVAHNIDLAPRAPVKPGESVGLRGQYEWNEQGGVIHWTHHDPRDRRPGGWILHNGTKYE